MGVGFEICLGVEGGGFLWKGKTGGGGRGGENSQGALFF